jgi:tape measure domain-containing protein
VAEKVGEIYYDVTLDTAQMIDGSRKVQRETERLETRFNAVAAAVAVLAAAMAAVKLAALADEFRLLGARVEVAAGSIEGGAAAMDALADISRRTQSSLAGNIEVFTRLNQSIKQMGGTQADTLQLTELLAKAIKVSGASAVEAKSAMLQFGQALGSGKLAGDELRSLLETAPYLMRQLADGLGVPVGALRKMGEEGKLTADVVTNALSKAATQIDADFKKFPQTIESAMVVARDQAALAALKFDELSGSSAILAGAAKGLGDVLERTAAQFGALNEQAGMMGRNEQVSAWASITRNALSYVADAADVAWQALSVLGRNVKFVFEGVGREIGGIMSQIAVFFEDGDPLRMTKAKWDKFHSISDAMKADAARARKELDEADARTLSRTELMGQQMRKAWEQGAGGGRGFVNPTAAPSQLKAPPGSGDSKAAKFDSAGYLAGLEKATLEGTARVDAIEREALRKNQALLEAGKISRQQAAEAVTLIERNAAEERQKIAFAAAEEKRQFIEKQGLQDVEQQKRIEAEKSKGVEFAQGIIVANDPIAQLGLELQRKSDLLAQYAAQDQENEQYYAQARIALEQQTNEKIREIVEQQNREKMASYQQTFDGVVGLVGTFAGKQSSAYRTMFAASKAFSVAQAMMSMYTGMAKALELGWPMGLVAGAQVLAQGTAALASIKSANYAGGRQWGGPVSSGSMYRINEAGAPEMFTGSNGRQYMLPTQAGKVTPADKVGGAPQWTVIVNEAPPGTKVAIDNEARIVSIAVAQAEANFVDQVSSNSGPMWGAMRGATNIQARNL